MSDDYYPAPDELRDFYMNDYDSGMPPDVEDETPIPMLEERAKQ